MAKPSSMSANDLRDALYRLEITQIDLAQLTHYSAGQINMMCRNRSPVPEAIAIIIRLMLEVPGIRERLFPWKALESESSPGKQWWAIERYPLQGQEA
jgi:hypothetical protein